MQSFIYVFDKEARDALLKMQYELLKSDEKKEIFVFVNKERQNFACASIGYALSDTLTF